MSIAALTILFAPDYLAFGIETNEIYSAGTNKWEPYAALHRYIYQELKKERPALPIFASWTLHNMVKERGKMLEEWKKLMPYNDLVAVSYYPFFVEDAKRLAALDWMTEQFDSFEKSQKFLVVVGGAIEVRVLPFVVARHQLQVGFVDHAGLPGSPLISHSCALASIAPAGASCRGDSARPDLDAHLEPLPSAPQARVRAARQPRERPAHRPDGTRSVGV